MTRSPRPTPTFMLLAMLMMVPGCAAPERPAAPDYQTVAHEPRRETEVARRHHQRALRLIDAGAYAEAERALKKALAADVTFGPAHNNLGMVYYHQDRLYSAAWEFQYAIKLMPHHPEPRNNLGLVLEASGRLDKAAGHYQEALELAPDYPELIGNLARARLRQGDRDEETRELLRELILKDNRRRWVEWAQEQLLRIETTPQEKETPGQ